MRIYIVRHGQTEANISGAVQTPETPLSETGIKQSQALAIRFADIPIEAIIASDYSRTRETSHILSQEMDLKIELSPLLRELADPHTWDFDKNSEKFSEYKERAQNALRMISERPEGTFVVVSHSNFIKLMAGIMLSGPALTPDLYLKIYSTFMVHNTGITVCNYENGVWQIGTWNDHAHLE